MININLIGEEKDRSAAYAYFAIAFSVLSFVFLAGAASLYGNMNLNLAQNSSDRDFKKSQNEALKKKTAEVDNLEAKQNLLKDKLNVIAQLKARKQGPVRVLDVITKTIPEKAWLTQITQTDDVLQVSGIALDGQTISDFMGALRTTPNIKETDSVSTELIVQEDLKLQKFSFPAKVLYFTAKGEKLEPIVSAEEKKK
jgi:type IV pilus assembly protein PilN